MAKTTAYPTNLTLANIDPRWVSMAYGLFALVLLVYELSLRSVVRASGLPPPTVLLLLAFLFTAPLTGALLSPQTTWQYLSGQLFIVVDTALVLGIIALSGGHASPFWMALLIPMLTALLILPRPAGVGVAAAIWLGYGALALLGPVELQRAITMSWLLQTAAVWLFLFLLEHIIAGQETLHLRAHSREWALQSFLGVSNRLRVSTRVQTVLEEVARAVQAVGEFDCVTLSRMEWYVGQAHLAVAIGASGRRLSAVEGLAIPWEEFAALFEQDRSPDEQTITCTKLPFRSIRNEQHLALPLVGQFGEIHGILTVSLARSRQAVLRESLPLLKLLANQAAAALDNTTLFITLEQRVQQSIIDLEETANDLRRARDRAEVLYHIARALAVTLDERQVLERALALVAQSTGAERGGIMLVEPNTGRLVFRTTLDRRKSSSLPGLERGRGLAGWVLAHREIALINDTTKDSRWEVRSSYDMRSRSVLAVPILIEREPLGVLVLIHSMTYHFNDDHAQLAMAAASQAAVALSKAQLYRYVSEQSERLSMTVQQREEEASKSMAILQSIGDGVIVGDRLGRIRLINPAAEEILGIKAEVFLGRALTELPGALQDNSNGSDSLHLIPLGERTLRAHFAPVVSAKEEWLGSVVVYHDITREVLADKLKSEFVATASHELRTPLTSIRGYVDMLKLGTFGALTDAQKDFLNIIKNNVGRLVELVDELLDISRADAGETRLRREEVDVAEMIHDVTEGLYGQFNERDISLSLDIPENLPAVMADRQRLEQILVNLVGNACKYTLPGGQVDVSLCNGNGEVRFEVRDTGVGIPDEAKPHIFTPFYRADNPLRDEAGGTGLGLSITRKLVELHGGRIWFESNSGGGSIFSFTLPIHYKERSIQIDVDGVSRS